MQQIQALQNYDPTQNMCYINEHHAITHIFPTQATVCYCGQMKLSTYVMCGKLHTTIMVNSND